MLDILKGYQSEWKIVFIICAVIYFVAGIFSISLLDARIQPWAEIDESVKNLTASEFSNNNGGINKTDINGSDEKISTDAGKVINKKKKMTKKEKKALGENVSF
jgi:hypothetical protein